MMKHRLVCLLATVVAGACLASAQNSQSHSSSVKPAPDRLEGATKPLTAKSAMPSPHKSSLAVPGAHTSTKGQNTDMELTRLERQRVKTTSPNTRSASSVPARKPAVNQKGSGIDFKYQQPVGGMQAPTPGARSPNSSTPRVVKKN